MLTGSSGPILLAAMDGRLVLALVVLWIVKHPDQVDGFLRELKYSSKQRQDYFGSDSERVCICCGAPLRSRRKYCYRCRPWGTRSPKE